MILTRLEILKELKSGRVEIQPFTESALTSNSYSFHLAPVLIEFPESDLAGAGDGIRREIGREGYLLRPGRLYLGLTVETTGSDLYSQILHGNRSIGSLGIWVHVTAPLGHVGSRIRWTLEICVVREVLVFPGMEFGKIAFLANEGEIIGYASPRFHESGKYSRNDISECEKYPEF
jgi:dCTP deaminase